MILQEVDPGLLLFRQTEHALLSADFAAAWGNDAVPAPPRRASTLVAAARHDDGWAQWELAPTLHADGSPVDFIRIPVDEHTVLYRRGIDLTAAEDPFAGLVASMHGERLYTVGFHPGMDPRIDHLEGEALALARAYVGGEQTRQERLSAGLDGDVAAHAEDAWRLLQVWDRLSLFVCMQPLGSGAEMTLPAIRGADGDDVAITLRTPAPDTLTLDPFPFADDAAFEIGALWTASRTWPDLAAFRRDYRAAQRRVLRFRCSAET